MSNIENKNVNKDVIYDENNGLYYTKIGDYYYPNIVVDNTEKGTLSKYGRARLRYLKEYNKGLYTELLMTGKLTEHLKEKCFDGFISESSFFRMCILNKEIKEKPDEKFYDTLEQLRGIATNINQIARVANQTRAIDIDSLKEFEKEVKDIISDLRKKYL